MGRRQPSVTGATSFAVAQAALSILQPGPDVIMLAFPTKGAFS